MKDWKRSAFTERLGIELPIVQGPFGGGLSSVRLTATVSNAGGLGSFGAHHLDADTILATATRIRDETREPFALNLWVPFENSDRPSLTDEEFATLQAAWKPYFDQLGQTLPERPERFSPDYEQQLEALLEARPAAFSFVYGIPAPGILAQCRQLGIATMGAATSPAEARALAQAGVDMVVASGFEAGGHRVSFLEPPEDSLMGGMSLIPQIRDAIDVPVIAAGGIADGRGIAAARLLGADAVQIGTAFLACEESGTTPLHRNALFSDAARHTGLTRVFSGRLARGIRNRLMAEGAGKLTAMYPVQNWFMGQLKKAAIEANESELMSLWCGQSAPLLMERKAASLVKSLVTQTDALLPDADV